MGCAVNPAHNLQPRQVNRDRAVLPRPPCSGRSTSRPSREAFSSRRWAADQHGCFHISFISIPSPCLLAYLPACVFPRDGQSYLLPPHARDNPSGGYSISPTKEHGHARESKWALIEGKTGRFGQAIGFPPVFGVHMEPRSSQPQKRLFPPAGRWSTKAGGVSKISLDRERVNVELLAAYGNYHIRILRYSQYCSWERRF